MNGFRVPGSGFRVPRGRGELLGTRNSELATVAVTRVVVVSPLPALRAGLRALLEAGGLQVVGEVARPELVGGLAADNRGGPDVVVLDADQPDPAELEALPPSAGLLLLGPLPPDERWPAALAGRAWGYLPREADPERLVAAVQAVGLGLLALDPGVGELLLTRADPSGEPRVLDQDEELTGREREVLQLVALGLANKAIARRLGISEHTVKFHVAAILTKLGAGSRTEAVHLAARRGLVAL
jgi:DNA-binding NarL/FixJ family response regulator